jgi:hypothetical protein
MPVSISGTNGVTFPDSSLQTAAASPYVLKNRIINGDMRVAQRGTSATISNASALGFGADRFFTDSYTWSAGSNITVSNETTVVPSGFTNSYKWANGATGLTFSAGGFQSISQKIEGYNIADAYSGNVTISFWVRSSTAGTYTLWIANNYNSSEIYTTKQYTINSANTWEQKSITVDLSGGIAAGGTWNKTNGEGLSLGWMLGGNANRTGNTGLNTWVNTNTTPTYAWNTSSSVQLATIANSTFYITGVQLEIGTSATPFERRLYGQELANCQRYYRAESSLIMYMSSLGSDVGRGLWLQYYGMRAAPTITGTLNSGSLATWYIGTNSAGLNTNTGDTTSIRYLISYVATAEL